MQHDFVKHALSYGKEGQEWLKLFSLVSGRAKIKEIQHMRSKSLKPSTGSDYNPSLDSIPVL